MRSYCFALTSPSGLEQLLRMGQFPDSERAICLAELVAAEFSVDENGQRPDWTMEVRDSEGSVAFSVAIGNDALHMTSIACPETLYEYANSAVPGTVRR